MTKKLKIKICGITDLKSMSKACSLGVEYIGFVFFENSPRNISFEVASCLFKLKTNKTKIVALTVNPTNALLDEIFKHIKPEFIQLHGNEKPSRCFEIKKNYKVKKIKSIEVKNFNTLSNSLYYYKNVVDKFILDSPSTILPGGNGKPFNWKLVKRKKIKLDWLLAGGLNSKNICQAIKFTHAKGVDISSGVEIYKGKKSPQLIENFVRKCRNIN